jgi:hypothetical protein
VGLLDVCGVHVILKICQSYCIFVLMYNVLHGTWRLSVKFLAYRCQFPVVQARFDENKLNDAEAFDYIAIQRC